MNVTTLSIYLDLKKKKSWPTCNLPYFSSVQYANYANTKILIKIVFGLS